jgi:conjugative transfer signal peptidase TraF
MKKRTIGIFALSTLSLILIGHVVGIRPNPSDSAPVGLWLERPITTPLRHGMMIAVCPPSTVPLVRLFAANGTLPYGSCPETSVARLLKPVRALPGDTVLIKRGNPVIVNGTPLPNTIASESHPGWPDGEYIVRPGEVWIFSSYSDKSFDSRYFGPVHIRSIQGEATPVLIVGYMEEDK